MSKELEVWRLLRDCLDNYTTLYLKEKTHIESVEGHSLDIIEKALKALEIIEEKDVDLQPIKQLKELTFEQYNRYWVYYKYNRLTQEEYRLLREVFYD